MFTLFTIRNKRYNFICLYHFHRNSYSNLYVQDIASNKCWILAKKKQKHLPDMNYLHQFQVLHGVSFSNHRYYNKITMSKERIINNTTKLSHMHISFIKITMLVKISYTEYGKQGRYKQVHDLIYLIINKLIGKQYLQWCDYKHKQCKSHSKRNLHFG